MQNRSATVVAESPTMLYELTARNLYTCCEADIQRVCDSDADINRTSKLNFILHVSHVSHVSHDHGNSVGRLAEPPLE
jgi:hypothetical protein